MGSKWGAERRRGTNANAKEKRNKDVENNEDPTASSLRALGLGATTAAGSWASASIRAAAITTTVNTLSRSTTPWPAHGPLTALLLGFDEDPDVPPILSLDPDTTLTTLSWWERSSDGTLGRVKLLELEEGAGFATNDLKVFDGSKA